MRTENAQNYIMYCVFTYVRMQKIRAEEVRGVFGSLCLRADELWISDSDYIAN